MDGGRWIGTLEERKTTRERNGEEARVSDGEIPYVTDSDCDFNYSDPNSQRSAPGSGWCYLYDLPGWQRSIEPSDQKKETKMKIATEPGAVEGTNDDDAAGTVLHAAEVTHDVAEAIKESEPEPELEASESEGPKTEKGETSLRTAKMSDASEVLQAARVFEDAEYFGAKFESFWNRLFSCYCAYDENSEFCATS
jgi:hypothetical protein